MQTRKSLNITVIGAGRWGSFLAWYSDKIGHRVTLYGKEGAKDMQEFFRTRSNGTITLPESLTLSTSISCVLDSDLIIISINSQGLRSLLGELKEIGLESKPIVLCMKGLEIPSGTRLSQIVKECLPSCPVAVWIGPGHVQEFYSGIPNCMVVDSDNKDMKEKLVASFSSELIRLYYGDDLVGNEIGAATKNVIGIAAGMLDGYKLSSLKGALMARGAREVSRLIYAMGGNELSAYGLCHLGDYEATVFSKYSHNRQFGESFIKGEKFDALAEGYYTVKAVIELEKQYNVELPICHAVYDMLYEGAQPDKVLAGLFGRSVKSEFYM